MTPLLLPNRRRLLVLALLLWGLTTPAARAQTVTITGNQTISGGYTDLTIARGGNATMSGDVLVFGTLRIQDGGRLFTNERVVGGNAFELQAGGTLAITSPDGIQAAGSGAPLGDIRTTTRVFSPDANYEYRGILRFGSGAVTQLSGSGLPGRVRSLTAWVRNIQGTPDNNQLLLSNDLSIAQRLLTLGETTVVAPAAPTPRTITLLSDATAGTALIAEPGAFPAVRGNVVIQRAINPGLNPGSGYRHLSAPVAGATVASLGTTGFAPTVNPAYNGATAPGSVAPFPTVFGYDQARLATSPAGGISAFDKGWLSPAATTDALVVGQGYTVNLPASSVVSFRGAPNRGDVALTLNRGGEAEAGWQLLGNPFPAPLDWSLVPLPAGLDDALYVYQSTAQYGGRYRSYVNRVGNPLVPLGQGFFVRVSQPNTTVALTVPDAARLTEFAPEPAVQRQAETRPLLQLTLAPAGAAPADELFVYFESGATAGVDARFDALKLQAAGSGAPALFAPVAGTDLAINGLPALSSRAVVPLGLLLPQAGTYWLEAGQLLNLSAAAVYLHDAATGQDVNLGQQPRYSFAAGAGALNGRFALRFEPTRPTAAAPVLSAASVQLFPNPAHGSFTLQLPAVPGAAAAQLTLLDALGQVVRRQTAALPAAGARVAFDARGLAAGVYTLRIGAGAEQLNRRVLLH